MKKKLFFLTLTLVSYCSLFSQAKDEWSVFFQISIEPARQIFHVRMEAQGSFKDSVILKMPAWTPGYYQLLNFADQVSDLKASTKDQKDISIKRSGRNGWKFFTNGKPFSVEYDVKASRSFVANPLVAADHAYIVPTGVFLHIAGRIQIQSTVEINLPEGWTAATGLEPIAKNKFVAPDFDVLYDSPILLGALEELPSFEVRGVPHRFVGYKLGDFDKNGFIKDLQKIVETSVSVIGHVPYKHYTFLAIGSGPGGIEHLNSTTFGFSGESLKTEAGKKRMYTFLAHEYFHHYNVKRIRPIELGPFDYDKENRTNMLWVSEGITVYYDELIVRRAGLFTDEELLESFRGRLLGFENKPGRLYQSATQASYNTWSDGPFGRSEEEMNKTVSVYDKGAILGLMLDFNIRQATQNKKSLDDVMRTLYQDFYQKKKRGFTEAEFQAVCEKTAGTKLTELFEYASTVKPNDYQKYFSYGGLNIDTQPRKIPGAWFGISGRMRNDSLVVTNVDYESPAWKAGIRRRSIVLQVNGGPAKAESVQPLLSTAQPGEKVALVILQKGEKKEFSITLGEKIEPDFRITKIANPTDLQKEILKSWTQ